MDVTDEEISTAARTLDAEGAAIVAAYRKGNLPELLNADSERKKAEADKAGRLNTMLGEGSGSPVPGAGQVAEESLDWLDWTNLNAATKKAMEERGVKIVNVPRHEEV